MKSQRKILPLLLAASLLVPAATWSADAAPAPAKAGAPAAPVPQQREVVTHGSVRIGNQDIHYTATAGTILLRNDKNEPVATMFYVAYTKDGVRNPAKRPITFLYNGGPGSSTIWLHLGGLGPMKVALNNGGATPPAPYGIVPNHDSLLDASDLVFVDAVGTGYSHVVGKGTDKMFWGVDQDVKSFGQFIQRYLTQFNRWNSPKFLLGESYGTTRSAVLAQDLVQKGVYINGVILCSTVLDLPTINFRAGNDLPYALYLPSYAAVAWYHHRLHPQPPSLPALVARAERFAGSEYLQALFAGDHLAPAEKQRIAARLAGFTGIPASLWMEADLRMTLPVYMRRLLGSAYAMTGRYDARFTTPEMQPLLPIPGQSAAGASTTAIWGALTASFDNYLVHNLHYTSAHLYKQDSGKVFKAWNWDYRSPLNGLGSSVGNLHARDVAPALARAMNNDPGMQLMLNNGYYDMATPFFATNYTLSHMGLPASLAGNIHEDYYPVGHMLYVNPKALPALSHNIDAFIAGASRGTRG